MILKNIKLRNRLKEIAKEASAIDDIILFGSAVRGKEKPADLDVLVLFKAKIDKDIEYNIRKELEKVCKNISIISKTRKTVLEESFDARESILFEGVSLITGKNLARAYGFSSLGLFKYAFKDWNKLKKTKFYYALNGREGKDGILQMLNCIKLSDGLILSPLDKIEPVKEFLQSWEIEYIYMPIIIPERLNKRKILQQ